ncbi:MAG: hypothetical protein GY810_08865 [Aureispira sp.]|nr:hypothetical protein [Aureispira sp.]
MKENQLCVLSQRFDGQLWFQPVLEPFNFRVSALGLNSSDGLIYLLNKENGHLLRVGKLGKIEDLGLPKAKEADSDFPYENITVGEIGGDYFCMYNKKTKSLYSIDLKNNQFSILGEFAGDEFTNIAYNVEQEQFVCVDATNRVLIIHPYLKESKMVGKMPRLPSGRAGIGNIWSTAEGRWFIGRMQNASLYELNLVEVQSQSLSTNLGIVVGDATSCPHAATPAFLDKDILNFYIEPYADNRLTSIKWADRGGLDIDRYEIEKSIDGRFWQMIDQKPSASNGIARMTPYVGLDKLPSKTLNYYRLKKVKDYGGQYYSHSILEIEDPQLIGKPFVTLAPNVVYMTSSTSLMCNGLEGEILTVEIEDSYGQQRFRTIYMVLSAQATFALPTKGLKTGVYTLNIKCTGKNFYKKLLVL